MEAEALTPGNKAFHILEFEKEFRHISLQIMLVTMEPVPFLSGTAAPSVSDRHLHICALKLHVLKAEMF